MFATPDDKCTGRECQVEPQTQSGFNLANVDVAMKFFEQMVTCLVKKGHLKISQITILTFYNAQKRRMINSLVDLGKQVKLTANKLADVVHTSDSFPGSRQGCGRGDGRGERWQRCGAA